MSQDWWAGDKPAPDDRPAPDDAPSRSAPAATRQAAPDPPSDGDQWWAADKPAAAPAAPPPAPDDGGAGSALASAQDAINAGDGGLYTGYTNDSPAPADGAAPADNESLLQKAGRIAKNIDVNLVAGAAGTGAKAAATLADVVGAHDTAASLDQVAKNWAGTASENGGGTIAGQVANVVGSVGPALLAPEGVIAQTVANAGLFGVPAFRDTLQQQIDAGADYPTALARAAKAFGVNMAMPMAAQGAGGAIGRLVGAEAMSPVARMATETAASGGAFAGIGAVSHAADKASNLAGGDEDNSPWVDGRQAAIDALAGGAMHAGGHLVPAAVQAAGDAARGAVAPARQAAVEASREIDQVSPQYGAIVPTGLNPNLVNAQPAPAAAGTPGAPAAAGQGAPAPAATPVAPAQPGGPWTPSMPALPPTDVTLAGRPISAYTDEQLGAYASSPMLTADVKAKVDGELARRGAARPAPADGQADASAPAAEPPAAGEPAGATPGGPVPDNGVFGQAAQPEQNAVPGIQAPDQAPTAARADVEQGAQLERQQAIDDVIQQQQQRQQQRLAEPGDEAPATEPSADVAAAAAEHPEFAPAAGPESDVLERDPRFQGDRNALAAAQVAVDRAAQAEQAQEQAEAAMQGRPPEPVTEHYPVLAPISDPALFQASQHVADVVESVFGARPVMFSDPAPKAPDGFAMGGKSFVNAANLHQSIMFTATHEAWHVAERLAGGGDAAAQAFVDTGHKIFDMMSPEAKLAYARDFLFKRPMTPDAAGNARMSPEQALAHPKLKSEMVGDFWGKRAEDREFWGQISRSDPKGFGRFARTWIDTLDKLIAGFKQKVGLGVRDVDNAFSASGLKRARNIAADALIEWRRANPELARDLPKPGESVLRSDKLKDDRPATHQVVDSRTGEVKGEYRSVRAARQYRDRYDMQHGAYVHRVVEKGASEPRFSGKQEDTPEFKRWFGEDSTLRNEDGSPMRLFHGTSSADIGQFKRSEYGAMGPAVYLGDDPTVGNAYAGDRRGANVMPVYARGKYLSNRQWTDYVSKHGWKGAEAAARADGWSGVHDKQFENAVAVWDPRDIKSAIGNRGTFDRSNPDIRFSSKFAPRHEDVLPHDIIERARAFRTGPKVEAPDPLTHAARAQAEAKLRPKIELAEQAKPQFDQWLKDVAHQVGGLAKTANVKALKRSATKLMTDYGGNLDHLRDLVRGSVIVPSIHDIPRALRALSGHFELEPGRLKDRFARPLETGYRDLLANVVLPNGTKGEVQLHIPEMMSVKDLGHAVYAAERELPDGQQKRQLVQLQSQIYGSAYDAHHARLDSLRYSAKNSDDETGSALDRMSDGLTGRLDGVNAQQDPSGMRTAGMPSQSKNLVPGGNDGSGMKGLRYGLPTEAGGYKLTPQKDGSIIVHGDQAELRSLLPPELAGKAMQGGLSFTGTLAPRAIAALNGEQVAYGRAGSVTENARYQSGARKGQYIGAPERYNTPAKIPALRRSLMSLAIEGEPGRYWYENSGHAVLEMVGHDREEARKFIALLAIYSPQAKVDANTTMAMRAWAQYKAGVPIDTKTESADAKATAVLYKNEPWGGEKTNNFYVNLMRSVDDEIGAGSKQGVTVDMWMMRAAGYDSDAPTAAAYRFVENETNRLAKELGWEPQQVQAAIWVAMKARLENPGVKKATEAESVKKGYMRYVDKTDPKTGKVKQVRDVLDEAKHQQLWLKKAMALKVSEDDTNGAKFDFSDGLRRHLGQVSWEARPGRSTGILPGIHDAPYHQQAEFQQAIAQAMAGTGGADQLAKHLGMMVDGTVTAPGVWQSEVSPSQQYNVPMVPLKGAKQGEFGVAPEAAKVLDHYAATMGLLLRQDGVGWHRPFFAATGPKANGVDLDVGRVLTPEEALMVHRAIDGAMRQAGLPDWEQKAALIASPKGIRAVHFDLMDNRAFYKLVTDAVEQGTPEEFAPTARKFASVGNLLSNDWKADPNGQGYARRLSASGGSDVLGFARDVLAPRIQAVFDDFSQRYGWGDPGKLSFSGKQPDRAAGGQPGAGRVAPGEDEAPERAVPQEALKPLPGAPAVPGFHGPDPRIVAVAEKYARDTGISLKRQAHYAEVDPERAARIAQAYEAMPHAPQDARVKAAYQDMIKQTTGQYKALADAGYKFWFMDMDRPDNQQYASSPWNAMRDLRANREMGVFPTAEGFGSSADFDPSSNPLLEDTGIKWPVGGPDGPLKPVLANDLFRAVHDAFGHGLEGSGFRAQGEENAWQAHARLFTGDALGALTSETRGQNSWLNYGPHGEKNRAAKVEDTTFADQKTGLMPEWTWHEGRVGDEPSFSAKQRAVEDWATRAMRGDSMHEAPVAPIVDGAPHPAFTMLGAGRQQPFVLDVEHARHIASKHPDITPRLIAELPDLLKNPRAILAEKPGRMDAIVDRRDGAGNPVKVALEKGEVRNGRQTMKVVNVQSVYGKSDSLRNIVDVAKMKTGAVWLPSKEVSRVEGLLAGHLSAPQKAVDQTAVAQPRPTDLSGQPAGRRGVQPLTTKVSVLSDEALRKFAAGDKTWASTKTDIGIPAGASLDGLSFSGKRQGASVAAIDKDTPMPGAALLRDATSRLSDLVDHALDRSGVYDKVAPMSGGDQRTRAMAQAHINAERQARYLWNGMAHDLTDRFTPEQRTAMWDAADEQNLLLTRGESTAGKGIDRLPADQRAVVEKLHQYSQQLWDKALEVGLVKSGGVPYWTPRMMAAMGEDGSFSAPGQPGGAGRGFDGRGRNIVTSAGSAKERKYETSQETEEAMAAMGGQMVRDIATMPIAMARFQRAIAGRQLIQDIKEIGQLRGQATVSDQQREGFFTMMDHPAFRTYAPEFEQGQDGKVRVRLDERGDPVMVAKPLYISSEFKGPLKAIMTSEDGPLYKAYMLLKSKAMSAIMASPMTHNLVIAGRAFSYAGLKLPALYVRGYGARQDRDFMGKMVGAGMVPISGDNHTMMDVGDLARGMGKPGSWLDPNESWIGLGAKAAGNALRPGLGDALKAGVDKAGDFWHGALLWDRIGDLQAGIAKNTYDALIRKGADDNTAATVAAHMANRYAGAVGRENMSEMARKFANVLLFSRSFNMGNIGQVKDVFYGLPAGLRAQMLERSSKASAEMGMSYAKRKAFTGLVGDLAATVLVTSLAQNLFKQDKDGYIKRAVDMWHNMMQHPLTADSYDPYRLSATYHNEPGKQDRVDVGTQPGGRHEYMRLPTGKVIEDLVHWTSHPIDTFVAKMAPLPKAAGEAAMNNKGFGRPVYDPSDSMLHIAMDIAKHLVEAQVPMDTIRTASDAAHGVGTPVDKDKIVGNLSGFSISQGHPGGPEAAVAQQTADRIKASKAYVMEGVRRDIKYGDLETARSKLTGIGLTPAEASSIIRRYSATPRAGMSRSARVNFARHANEQERQQMEQVGE